MSWLDDFGFDLIMESQVQLCDDYCAAQNMRQDELISFLKIHENEFPKPNEDDEKSKNFYSLTKNILEQALKRKLSEKQRNVLNNYYAYNIRNICPNYGEDCEYCSGENKTVNRVEFLRIIREEKSKDYWEKLKKVEQNIIVKFLEERKEDIPENNYKKMVLDILEKSKSIELTDKQRTVLNNTFFYNFFEKGVGSEIL